MRKKVLIANLTNLRVTQTAGLYQYDYGQELNILGTGITSAIEIHYTNGGNALVTLANPDGDTLVSQIPDELLESSGTITAYIYYTDETSGQTVYKVIIPVIERAKPEDYTPTEREKTLAEEAIEALEKNLLFVNTEKTEDGAEITITDRNGNHIVNLSNGEDGEPGEDGNGIESIEQTTTSTESEGINVVTVNMTDGETATFEIRNGARGEKGEKGDKGDKGEKGDNGSDAVLLVNITRIPATETTPAGYHIEITDSAGSVSSADLYNGKDGTDGTDYILTASDKQDIADIIMNEIGNADTTAY